MNPAVEQHLEKGVVVVGGGVESAAAGLERRRCAVVPPGYDRVRVLLDTYAGLDLHQLRHSAATHLGDAEVPLRLIMGKTRHKNPRTAMRYVKPGAEAIAKVTEVLAPRRRTH
ncbi:tyrosine-type recombinase/integrase [Streptosporangium sp. G11]|uniref:tyrosine-type recombinase/integrase n=1 Tax=Streptosporangium sp. G11 TaxID=3436926 RepID=UPI003EBA01B9